MKWLPVVCNSAYEVSDVGDIRDNLTHEVLPQHPFNGYLRVNIQRRTTDSYVHRLVACAFLPNPQRLPIVRHKDSVRSNNYVGNLAWGTQADNVQDAGGNTPVVLSKDGEVTTYRSMSEAAKVIGATVSHVHGVCNGRGKTVKGYFAEYLG